MTHANGNSVSAVLEVSRKVYATSLVLYPNELRDEFGAEMVEVFDEQVSEAYSRSGFPGLLRVWFSATREFVTIALPGRLTERMLPIVAVTAALALLVWFAGYIGYVMETACAGCGH
jgi:hypothetical protein